MIIEIQCLPKPAGTDDDPHAHIEAAIALIEESGLAYEVGPLGTSVEGTADELWPLLRRAHEACLAAGADTSISVIKVFEASVPSNDRTMASLTAKFREA